MKSFTEFLLQESTFSLGKDVDFLYNFAYKNWVDKIQDWDSTKSAFPKLPKKIEISSSKLKSKDAKKAHSINPITIEFSGAKNDGNAYVPAKHKIIISPNQQVLSLIKKFGNIENVVANIQKKQEFAFKDEITEKRIKGSIYHELSHWVDDSLHNFHITTMLNNAKSKSNLKDFKKILAQGGADSIDSFYEINAQIHTLKQYKKSIKPVLWNRLKWSDVERIIASINNISERLKSQYGIKEYNRWKKEILKRMSREKLIGKNMKFN